MNWSVRAAPATALPLVHGTGPAMAAQRIPMWASVALAVAAPIARIPATKSRRGRTIFGVSVMRRSPLPVRSRRSSSIARKARAQVPCPIHVLARLQCAPGGGVEQVQLLMIKRHPDGLVRRQPGVRRHADDHGVHA